MIETILIARDRKTGKDVLLSGRNVPFREQLAKYKDIAGPVHDEFDSVILATVQPHKKPLKFITKAEASKRVKPPSPTFEAYVSAGYAPESYPPTGCEEVPSHGLTAFRELQAKAKAEAEKKSPAKKNKADKTENKTK